MAGGKFVQVYSNLPLPARKEIVAVIDGEPVSWDVAYKEIAADTEKGRRILEKLETLGII